MFSTYIFYSIRKSHGGFSCAGRWTPPECDLAINDGEGSLCACLMLFRGERKRERERKDTRMREERKNDFLVRLLIGLMICIPEALLFSRALHSRLPLLFCARETETEIPGCGLWAG